MTLSINRHLGEGASSCSIAVIQVAAGINRQPVPGITAPLAELVAAGKSASRDGTTTSNQTFGVVSNDMVR